MDGERLESMRRPPRDLPIWLRWRERVAGFLVVALFNVFPLPRKAGFRRSFGFAGDLIDRGWNVLVFPEGERSRTGAMNPFRSGIGILASGLNVPVVPMRLNGIAERRALGKHWAPPFQLEVAIGPPMAFADSEPAESIAKKLESAVEALRP
jgi:long-chain acyl-CoA synthetase